MKVTFGLDATSRSYDNAQKGEPRDFKAHGDLTAPTILTFETSWTSLGLSKTLSETHAKPQNAMGP